ncbi:unnamed protein product [Rangifer tarandus platyrhynchus]|uniref:Uncharacterized protein n=1 Tax=Rangifer tarandus platyrhynchus TaxID=3082113 RepID=A0AC59Y512_RANTA
MILFLKPAPPPPFVTSRPLAGVKSQYSLSWKALFQKEIAYIGKEWQALPWEPPGLGEPRTASTPQQKDVDGAAAASLWTLSADNHSPLAAERGYRAPTGRRIVLHI